MHLALVFHNHQPVGQFPWAFDEAWRGSYQPFLDVLEEFPEIRVALHYTGPLIEWLARERPATIAQIRRMVESGQVELLGGGYYEPILAIWPPADRVAQLRKLAATVHDVFGTRPEGAWLAERVWEPALAATLREADVAYTFVDSAVFASGGIAIEASRGYFEIESAREDALCAFPINEPVRHCIPWHAVDEVMALLRDMHDEGGENELALFADDGEKFGAWPGTFELVFKKGWLREFFEALRSNASWLPTIHPGAYRQRFAPLGRLSLPAGSYSEMQAWSGGNWRNFLDRYSESGDMYRAVCRAGAAARELPAPAALDHVLSAQSNDAYWHGVFGGLYLRHLRQAIYAETAAAWEAIDAVSPRPPIQLESNGDCFLNDRAGQIGLRPGGGELFQWLCLPARHNSLAALRRYDENYHDSEAEPDWYARGALIDHFFGDAATPENFAAAAYPEQGDFVSERWGIEIDAAAPSVTLRRDGGVWQDDAFLPLTVTKTVTLGAEPGALSIRYALENASDREYDLWWGIEWNVALSGNDLPDRHYHARDHAERLSLREPASHPAVANPIAADRWLGLWVEWNFPIPVAMWHVPLFTVSQKEGGEIEKTYQQSAFVFHQRLRLPAGGRGEFEFTVVTTSRESP